MKQLILLLLIFFFYFSSTTISQNPEWINYTNGDWINAIEMEGDLVWVGTLGAGLVKIDRISGKTTFYDKINSGLPSNDVNHIAIDKSGNKWILNYDQLVKFDGANWTVYDLSNLVLEFSEANCLAIDQYDKNGLGLLGEV